MDYADYINSAAWRNSPARLSELEAAGHRCRTCNAPAAEIVLHVHHRTYARFGAEAAGDLTTLCSECHPVITDHLRRRRFAGRTPLYADITPAIADPTPLRDPTFRKLSHDG
jgi:5-methylcytosine-specific restriction endonuclease McrA